MTLVLRERDPQLTAEKIGGVPQARRETVVAMSLVPRARVQQQPAEQIEDAPRSLEETFEAVTLVPRDTSATAHCREIRGCTSISERDV